LPKTVEVPIATPCPAPPAVKRPDLPLLAELKPNSPPNEVIKAYAVSLEELAGYATLLENYLNAYRTKQ